MFFVCLPTRQTEGESRDGGHDFSADSTKLTPAAKPLAQTVVFRYNNVAGACVYNVVISSLIRILWRAVSPKRCVRLPWKAQMFAVLMTVS